MTLFLPSHHGEYPNCHCIDSLSAALSTLAPSLYCDACGYLFEVRGRPARNDAWLSQSPANRPSVAATIERTRAAADSGRVHVGAVFGTVPIPRPTK